MTVRFRRASEPQFEAYRAVRVPLEGEPGMHRYTVGSTVPLALDGAGTVRLELACTSPVTVRVGTVAVISPRREMYYRDRYLETRKR
jgi:hypothetical protein